MAFQLSPGVSVAEIDATSVVTATSSSIGGTAISATWGPANDIVSVTSETQLVEIFRKPSVGNVSWMTASAYLAYSGNLKVVRAIDTATAKNAIAAVDSAGVDTAAGDAVLVENSLLYYANYSDGLAPAGAGMWAAKYPGALANGLKVSFADSNSYAAWAYKEEFAYTPGASEGATAAGGTNDELHVIIIDGSGKISGNVNQVLEKFSGLSKAANARGPFGETLYYAEAINRQSKYIWWLNHPVGATDDDAWGLGIDHTYTSEQTAAEELVTFAHGVDGDPAAGDFQSAFEYFANDELVDVNLLFTGDATLATQNAVIDIAMNRKDCLAFISPQRDSVVGVTDGSEVDNITGEANTNSSYAVKDSGWKYTYDRYNDTYMWLPCNGDVAGICAATDRDSDPWFSPAGYNRGQIKNAVRLAYSPNKVDRDDLYKKNINPIVGFPGSGIVLFGDKTLVSKPSAFDRINVRRLFIVLEKAIATAAKYQLFEFNDAFTRAQFKNMIEPFLRSVQGRRGIVNFKVVCDESNNTGQIIDTNSFVADIFIQPTRSINFIQLNFVATRSGVVFNESAGV